MLEYCKTILTKVDFDYSLFWKEYRKSIEYLREEEAEALHKWISERYRNNQAMAVAKESHVESNKMAS